MSPFHARTARPISTKFCTDIPTNSGKVLNTSMDPPIRPLDPRVPQTPKPKCVTGEKTLSNVKCPDGYPYTVLLISLAAPGPGRLVFYKLTKIIRSAIYVFSFQIIGIQRVMKNFTFTTWSCQKV